MSPKNVTFETFVRKFVAAFILSRYCDGRFRGVEGCSFSIYEFLAK